MGGVEEEYRKKGEKEKKKWVRLTRVGLFVCLLRSVWADAVDVLRCNYTRTHKCLVAVVVCCSRLCVCRTIFLLFLSTCFAEKERKERKEGKGGRGGAG